MIKLFAAAAVALAPTVPVHAQMLDSADDPAFESALSSLLAKDDPAAVATLRNLAEAGNAAALVTLPFVLQWVPPQGNLKEKNTQRKVGGVHAHDAAAEAHGATALWNMGRAEGVDDLPDRAAGLLDQGEPEKAAFLLATWFNQTGARGALPQQLLADDTPAWLGGFALSSRLIGAISRDGAAKKDSVLLLSLIKEDRLVGWVAYVAMLDRYPDIFNIIGNPLAGTGLSADRANARIVDARAVRAVSPELARDDTPTPAATAIRARNILAGRAELLPVTRLCQAHCPDSLATCEAAVLAYPGQSFGGFEVWQPFADVLDPLAFAASDRGLAVLIPKRQDPAAAADRATAAALDACYGALLARRDTLGFGP